MKLRIPYLQWRGGRPRWEPGPGLRSKGWKGRDLKDEGGAWLDLNAAVEAAEAINAEVEAWRASGTPRRRPAATSKPTRTAVDLWDAYRRSPRYTRMAVSTQADYRRKAAVFLGAFGADHVGAIDKARLYRWWEALFAQRGHAMANGVLAVARAMLSHATRIGWRADNPAAALGLDSVPPRQVFWLPEEVVAIVAAADAIGAPSVGDAVIIALHSGQRLGDVLTMPDRIFEQRRIRLSQAKMKSRGGALVDAPMTHALHARVAEIKARKNRAKLTRIDTLVLRDDTGQPYDAHSFNKAFRRARQAAAETCPGMAEKRFQDLRDTAVTRLALAGCELPQIAAITGHSLTSITQIIKHYLVLQPEMADAAIAKLSAWLGAQEIAL
jgi:hypothetical protein